MPIKSNARSQNMTKRITSEVAAVLEYGLVSG